MDTDYADRNVEWNREMDQQSGAKEQRKGQTLPTSTAKYDFVCCVIVVMSARQC